MRKYVLSSILVFPLLLSFSHAAQSWSVDTGSQPLVFSSEEGGTSSYLGVDIADVTSERLSNLKLKEEKGVEVTMVDQDAPAGKAGIKEHDVILTMNGSSVDSAAQLRRMIHETPAGRLVAFGLSRDGQPMTVKVQLADRHNEFAMVGPKVKDLHIEIPEMHMPEIDMPSFNMVVVSSSARSGLTVENITPQLGEFFGVKNGNGVLVRAVDKGSRAEKAGFRAGDVIVRVNDQSVHDTSDFTHAVHSRDGGAVSVGVIREKKEQNLNLTLPDRKDSGEMFQEESLNNLKAQIQPYMEMAVQQQTSAEELRKVCQAQKQIRQQTERARDRMRVQQEELKKQLEQMRRQWGRNSADI